MRSAPRRHDLVWLDPGARPGQWQTAPDDGGELRAWIARHLPLVAARPTPALAPAGWLTLGFTVPGQGPRRRITVLAAPQIVIHQRAPLTVAEALPHAPAAWCAGMARLDAACRAAGLTPRIYGSLAGEIFSGQISLNADSDLDVLIDCADGDQVRAAVAVLRTADAAVAPRLDGELRLANGWAVAWRELAAALAAGGSARVLAKSNTLVAMLTIAQLLPEPEAPNGRDRLPAAQPLPA